MTWSTRTWKLPREAGRRLMTGATKTISPLGRTLETSEPLAQVLKDCPGGLVGDRSVIQGQHLRRPLGVVELRARQLVRLGALTERDVQDAGFPTIAAFFAAWDHYRGEEFPRASDPWVWVLTWEVVMRPPRFGHGSVNEGERES